MALSDEWSMDAIVAQAAAYAQNEEWPQAQMILQIAQIMLLAKIANEPTVLQLFRKHWTRV